MMNRYLHDMREYPQEFVKTVVTDVKLNNSSLTPDGDGINDTVSGTVVLAKPYDGGLAVVNAIGRYVNILKTLDKNKLGTYSFTWDGKDSYNNKVFDGPYYIQPYISEGTEYGSYIAENSKINVKNSKPLIIAQPEQKVRILQRDFDIDPYYKFYDYPGNEFSIISFEALEEPIYHIKVAEGVVGTVDVRDVEMVELDKLPVRMGVAAIYGVITRVAPTDISRIKAVLGKDEEVRILRRDGDWYRIALKSGEQAYARINDIVDLSQGTVYTVVAGDTLWKIAQQFSTTVSEIAQLNNIGSSTPLHIGQKLLISGEAAGQNSYIIPTSSPDVKYVKLSPRKINYQGGAAPGYLIVDIETKEPMKGYIEVSGAANTTRINLNGTYKTAHVVTWAPWDDGKKQQLPVGDYKLLLNLFKQNGEGVRNLDLGKLTVVSPWYTVSMVNQLSVKPDSISPQYNVNESNIAIVYSISRPGRVQLVVKDDKGEYFHTPLEFKNPGVYKYRWNGRADHGELMKNGKYLVEARGIESSYNTPDTVAATFAAADFQVYNSEYRIPEERIRQVVPSVTLENSISPNEDGIQDTLNGTITTSEKARVGLNVVNAVDRNVSFLLSSVEREAGTYPFSWNGKDFMGSPVLNGPYYLDIILVEGESFGNLVLRDKKITVTDSIEMVIPPNAQKIKVMEDKTTMDVNPYGQGYVANKGDVFIVLGDTQDGRYMVKVAEGVTGFIDKWKVEITDIQSIPQKWGMTVEENTAVYQLPYAGGNVLEALPKGTKLRILREEDGWYRVLLNSGKQGYVAIGKLEETSAPTPPVQITHIVAAGDSLWGISQKYGTSIDAVVKANNLNPNAYLYLGQKLLIPAGQEPVNSNIYTVKAGDNLWKIAQGHGVTVTELVLANNLTAANPLMIGQKLIIPKLHIVASGDTLWKIAAKYNTTIQKIAQLNKLDISKPLYVGQRIRVA